LTIVPTPIHLEELLESVLEGGEGVELQALDDHAGVPHELPLLHLDHQLLGYDLEHLRACAIVLEQVIN
jgi:hypothetical protein